MIKNYSIVLFILCLLRQYSGIFEIQECGRRIIEESVQKSKNSSRFRRIVNGNNAYHGQWPWIVSLKNPVMKAQIEQHNPSYMNWSIVGSDSHICGGTLINAEWIVTAKHCLFYNVGSATNTYNAIKILKNWTATLGSFNIMESTNQEISIAIDKVIPLNDDNDFAMMHLSTAVNFTDYIIPACLPNTTLANPGTDCYAVGWGTTYSLNNTLVNPVLKHATLRIMSRRESSHCQSQTNKEICTSPLSGSVCRGDSGGPLLCQDKESRWVIVGITSRGSGCKKLTDRSIFTSIYHQLEFVYRTVSSGERLKIICNDFIAFSIAFLTLRFSTSL